jgi:hypothetical protein
MFLSWGEDHLQDAAVRASSLSVASRLNLTYFYAYRIDAPDLGPALTRTTSHKRRFLSYEAAIGYVKRMVSSQLRLLGNHAAGSAVTYSVNVLPEESQKSATPYRAGPWAVRR